MPLTVEEAVEELKVHSEELTNVIADVMCKEYLESIDYEDGTLLDFFTMTSEEIDEDISLIYPMVASLSEGQRAGLDFLTMERSGRSGRDRRKRI